MGNHLGDGIPPLLAKNWQPIPNISNIFRNKVTHQYAQKHIINIEDPKQLESLKSRLKQSNPFICRVLFYHQYHETIYHIYTEQLSQKMDNTSNLLKFEQIDINKWLRIKLGIIQAFWSLAQQYGYMRVCRQMIGCDGNGCWKVWINPDPCAHYIWNPVLSEQNMLRSLIVVLEQIQKDFDTHEQSDDTFINQRHFPIAINNLKMRIDLKQGKSTGNNHKNKKSGVNKTSSYIQNNTTNFNININIEMEGKKNKKISNNHTLQKLFNPVVCQTSRGDDQWPYKQHKKQKTAANRASGISQPKMESVKQRPISYFQTKTLENITVHDSQVMAKRRGSDTVQSTKLLHFSGLQRNNLKSKNESYKAIPSHFQPKTHYQPSVQTSNQRNSQLKNLTPTSKFSSPLQNFLSTKYPKTPKDASKTATNFHRLNNQSGAIDQSQKSNDNRFNKNISKGKQVNNLSVNVSDKYSQINSNPNTFKAQDRLVEHSKTLNKKNISIPYFLANTQNSQFHYQNYQEAGKNKKQGQGVNNNMSYNQESKPITNNSIQLKKYSQDVNSSKNKLNFYKPPSSYKSNLIGGVSIPSTDRHRKSDNNKNQSKQIGKIDINNKLIDNQSSHGSYEDKGNKTLFQFYSSKYSNLHEKQFKPQKCYNQRESQKIKRLDDKNDGMKILSKSGKDKNDSEDSSIQDKIINRGRKNTAQQLKDQLSSILDVPVVANKNPVSEQFQLFKKNKEIFYDCQSNSQKGYIVSQYDEHSQYQQQRNNEQNQRQSAKNESEMIKEKVQKKKATFAHLKMEVMKMLEDDI